MTKNITKKSTSARTRLTQKQRYEQGHSDGHEWVATSDPLDAQELINEMGQALRRSPREAWVTCPLPDLRERLRSHGPAYTFGFMLAVQNAFQAEHSALVFHRHQEGVEDGRRWTSQYADGGQHARIREFAQANSSREIFVGPNYRDSWTPAHLLVDCLLADAYPADEDGEQLEDCKEFREFWQPFVDEPMDKVMSNLRLYGFRAGHKLQDHHYIAGFIDGALGLSDQLGRWLSERTPLPYVGSISGE